MQMYHFNFSTEDFIAWLSLTPEGAAGYMWADTTEEKKQKNHKGLFC